MLCVETSPSSAVTQLYLAIGGTATASHVQTPATGPVMARLEIPKKLQNNGLYNYFIQVIPDTKKSLQIRWLRKLPLDISLPDFEGTAGVY